MLAVPVAPERWTRELRGEADEFVCVSAPRWYRSVGEWYRDFTQTTDDEVIRCLAASRPLNRPELSASDDATGNLAQTVRVYRVTKTATVRAGTVNAPVAGL